MAYNCMSDIQLEFWITNSDGHETGRVSLVADFGALNSCSLLLVHNWTDRLASKEEVFAVVIDSTLPNCSYKEDSHFNLTHSKYYYEEQHLQYLGREQYSEELRKSAQQYEEQCTKN